MQIRFRSTLFFLCLAAGTVWGQEFRATLTGRVTDPSGAPVAGATVTPKNLGTNVTYAAKTDSRGNYTALLLPPGSYSINVSAAGFKQTVRTGVTLAVAEATTVDFTLEIGELNQEVTVTAEVGVLEVANGDRGGVVDAEMVTEYPLNGRNPFMLAALVPGVIYNGELIYQRPFDNGATARWDISGSGGNNEFLLDGAPNNAQAGGNNVAYTPPVDSVQEFKIQTSSYDAQYGKSGGGIINVALKSGSNRIHGTAYEFMRRNALDANSYQNNAHGAPKDGHYLDQYGGELDGPLYFPKIYDGRNKTFFLFNYEGYREATPQPLVLSVPSPEMRTGDFSKLKDASGRQVIIYDPSTTRNVSPYIRDAFPGNIIPSSRINPIAARILTYFPQPNINTPGVNYAQQNYYASGGYNPAVDHFYNMVFKFDENLGTRNHVFFRQGSNDRTEMRGTNGIVGQVGADGPLPLKRVNDAYALDWVTVISPTMIFNARVSFGRYIEGNYGLVDQNFDMTSLGFPKSLATALPYNPGFGMYQLTNYLSLGKTSPSNNVTNTWASSVTATKVNGTHTTKGGFDIRFIQYAVETPGTVFQLNENTVFTAANYANTNDALSGNSVAGWLLGTPSSGTVNYNSFFIYMQPYMAPWIQHDWKVSSRLSVNFGLRWDLNFPPNERFDRLNRGFDAQVVSPLDAQVNHTTSPDLPNPLRGGMLFAGVGGAPARAANLYLNTWQPRFGLAYTVARNTVLRGGWGRYYVNPSNNYQQSFGFNAQTTMTVSPDGNRTTYPNLINDPFPTINQPRGAADGLLTYVGRSFNFVNADFRVPHVDQFTFGVQRMVGSRGRFEVTYSGSRGNDIEATKAFDTQASGAFRDNCDPLLGHLPTYCNAGITNPFRNLPSFVGTSMYTNGTISRNQILFPYPQYTGLTEYMLNTGKSWYNSLQSLFNIRMRNGINLNANYTFSKNEQRTGYLDPQNDIMQQGLVQYDRPHRFVVSMVTQLPFGRGHRWLNGAHGIAGRLVNGWEQTLMFTTMSGQPWALPSNVLYVQNAVLPHGWGGEKIQVIKPCVSQSNDDLSFTMLGFSKDYGCTQPNFIVVNTTYNPRYTPYYDGRIRYSTIVMADASLNKMTQINERLRMQFRAEVFNIANSFFVSQFSSGTQAIDNVPTDPNFGILYKSTVSAGLSNYPRQIQLGFKFLF